MRENPYPLPFANIGHDYSNGPSIRLSPAQVAPISTYLLGYNANRCACHNLVYGSKLRDGILGKQSVTVDVRPLLLLG